MIHTMLTDGNNMMVIFKLHIKVVTPDGINHGWIYTVARNVHEAYENTIHEVRTRYPGYTITQMELMTGDDNNNDIYATRTLVEWMNEKVLSD